MVEIFQKADLRKLLKCKLIRPVQKTVEQRENHHYPKYNLSPKFDNYKLLNEKSPLKPME